MRFVWGFFLGVFALGVAAFLFGSSETAAGERQELYMRSSVGIEVPVQPVAPSYALHIEPETDLEWVRVEIRNLRKRVRPASFNYVHVLQVLLLDEQVKQLERIADALEILTARKSDDNASAVDYVPGVDIYDPPRPLEVGIPLNDHQRYMWEDWN